MNTKTPFKNTRTDKPSQPIDSFLQEAENLYVWCKDDALKLASAGITPEMIEELPHRSDLCRDAQSEWNKIRTSDSTARKEWDEALPKAICFRAELIRQLRFAFRKDARLLRKVYPIAKEKRYSRLIQDLYDIAVVGREHTELLRLIDFDVSLLDLADSKSRELAGLWSKAQAEDAKRLEYMLYRNRTFWHLNELVNEIRSVGKFVFRKDHDRLKGYSSIFWKRRNSRKKRPLLKNMPHNSTKR